MSSAFGVRLNCPAYSNRSTMTRFVWGARGCHPQMNPQRAVSRACGTAWAGIEQTMPATQKDESSRQDDLARCIELDLGRLRSNESRLSCGALKKDSFRNLRAPPASSACLGSGSRRTLRIDAATGLAILR